MDNEQNPVPREKTKEVVSKKKKTKEVCFVIMPFGGWGDDYYETIYRPAIESAGLDTHRADDLFRPSTIVNDIWAYTKKARLLLADLSGKNPNVFYELGLAHALAKPVILIAESIEEIPFDLRALRVITYDKHDPEWGRNLRDKVAASVKEILKSPLDAVLPAFLEVKASSFKHQVTPHEKELIEIKQELDLLKREVRSRGHYDEIVEERRIIGPNEARSRIRHYWDMGLTRSEIVERISRMGPPQSWILREIGELKSARKSKTRTIKPLFSSDEQRGLH